jgi:hypothetical protein
MRALTAIMIITCIFAGVCPIFAQPAPAPFVKSDAPVFSKTLILSTYIYNKNDPSMFNRWFNSRVIAPRRDDGKEKQQLREQWEEFLGIDVFSPYFKVRAVEKYVQNKTRVEFFNFKGRAEFETGSSSFKYIFKRKF